jgi:hypothetical protein
MILLADFLRSLSALLSLNAIALTELAEVDQPIQNWPSDPLGQTGGAPSIGFIGGGPHLGAEF